MSFKRKVNNWRRSMMKRLTKRVGNSHFKNIDTTKKLDIKRVLITRPNHRLGNLLLTTPLLQEIEALFPNAKVDLVVQGGLAPILYENYKNVDRIITLPKRAFKFPMQYIKGVLSIRKQKYDIAINGVKDSSSGKLFAMFSKSKYKIFGEEEDDDLKLKYKDYIHFAKQQVYSLREYLYKLGYDFIEEPVASLSLKLSRDELSSGEKIVKELVKNDKKTMCIFTFATGAKCYPESWWLPFYKRLKTEYADYNIIEILPVENVSQIQFKAPSFYSKDVREIGAVIANTEIFVGADSGIMHLASASGGKTVGLFSVTTIGKYEPYNNGVALDTTSTDINGYIDVINKMLNQTI